VRFAELTCWRGFFTFFRQRPCCFAPDFRPGIFIASAQVFSPQFSIKTGTENLKLKTENL
jgi:hypothetical protein